LDLSDWPFSHNTLSMVEALREVLGGHGYTLVLHTRGRSPADTDVWRTITPAAAISLADFDSATAEAIRSAGTDVIISMFGRRATLGNTFAGNERRIASMQIEHLASRGYRKLIYAAADEDRFRQRSNARMAGARSVCRRLGIQEPTVAKIPTDIEGATSAVRDILRSDSALTAAFCTNDDVGLAVLAGLRANDATAPSALGVIGVGDIPAAQLITPSLTTVRVDTTWVATHMGQAILAALNGEPSRLKSEKLPLTLIERETT